MMRRLAVPLFPAAAVALHAGLTLYFVPPAVVLGGDPIAGLDFDAHYQQTLRAVEAHRASGRTWSYDPHLLAGHPAGTVFDADNKLVEMFAVALDGLGVPPHRSFNLFVWLLHFLAPLVVFASARLFGLSGSAAVVATFLTSAIWFFDVTGRWCAFVGMFSWASASCFWLLPLGLFHRWISGRRPLLLLGVLVSLSLLHTLHPYVFFLLAPPMGIMWWRARRSLGPAELVGLAGVAVGVVAANWWWLSVAAAHRHYVIDSALFMDATPAHLLYDYLGLIKEPEVSGVIAVRTGFRFLAFGAAALGLLAWRRSRDERLLPIAVTLGLLFLAAYGGGWAAWLRQVQPYRFVLPAAYLAALVAADWLVGAARSLRAERPRGGVAGVLILLAFLLVPRLARDVIYFIPALAPRSERALPAPPPDVSGGPAFGGLGWREPFEFRHKPIPPHERLVADTVRALDDGSGRWLVEWWGLGERLAWTTGAQIVFGFRAINLVHAYSSLFHWWPDESALEPGELEAYLERYNVRWVVMSNRMPSIEGRTDLLEPIANLFSGRIYRTKVESGWIVGGGPGEVRAALDRITVRGSAGGSLVLRYHYHESLVCRPGCRVYRAPVEGSRVGFIGVENAPSDFEIVNP